MAVQQPQTQPQPATEKPQVNVSAKAMQAASLVALGAGIQLVGNGTLQSAWSAAFSTPAPGDKVAGADVQKIIGVCGRWLLAMVMVAILADFVWSLAVGIAALGILYALMHSTGISALNTVTNKLLGK